MKKRTIRLLRGGLWLLLCVALTLCALSLRSEAPPREDVDAASRMLVSSSELLYDADSTSQIDSSSLSGEAEEPPPPEQPEPPQETPPEQTESPAEAPPQDVPSDDSGIGDLMDIGSSGGGSGGQLPARRPGEAQGSAEVGDPDRYFETSIIDGDVVDYERYTFTIRHLKPELQVLGLTVTLNGQSLDYKASSSSVLLKLAEGANSIVVRAFYSDGANTVTASQGYTVYYGAGGEVVIIAVRDSDGVSLADLRTTSDSTLSFTAYGLKDGSKLRVSVRFNGKTVTGSGDRFSATLEYGVNTFEISAGGRNDTVTARYTVEYKEDGFKITNSFNGTIPPASPPTLPRSSPSIWTLSPSASASISIRRRAGSSSGRCATTTSPCPPTATAGTRRRWTPGGPRTCRCTIPTRTVRILSTSGWCASTGTQRQRRRRKSPSSTPPSRWAAP